ncbi:MAG TPA: 4a-hydroxytetrahydrobiopterin dehydratase [Xanthomonadales bacterium]|nr:4a-hydroxytetrahydrobiopterin dehydratase [Xanthomonadales bacterium]
MKLPTEEITSRLARFPHWKLQADKLHREYKFSSFVEAFGFMASAALVAETLDHHPEWFNVYNKVIVDLTTHDAGGVSEKDFALAEHMDRIAGLRP